MFLNVWIAVLDTLILSLNHEYFNKNLNSVSYIIWFFLQLTGIYRVLFANKLHYYYLLLLN